jgi:ATP-binding cassette, subfamily C (CFTR/MRP), member 1
VLQSAYIPAVFSPFLTFTLLAFFKKSGTNLNVAQAFTSLSLISLLAAPLQTLLGSLPSFAASVACFDRVETYLNSREKQDNRQAFQNPSGSRQNSKEATEHLDHSKSIMLQDMIIERPAISGSPSPQSSIISIFKASFGADSLGRPILSDVSLEVRRSSFHCIIGTVGSGKSTLLKALLGEATISSGFVKISTHDLAYCDQQSWLVNGNLKKNIVGESIYNKDWYDCVVHACCLQEDIVQLSHGDLTMVGSKGITLSGGQKQRVVSSSFPSRRIVCRLTNSGTSTSRVFPERNLVTR